ncbi:MAG: NUDIX domain-containing protein [Chitinophagaceae bacterium]|nr:NUDIX domain-containing protein [Chitinophagaceae bacterium]
MSKFNVRVYGILTNEKRQVLVSDEYIRGNFYTKFPGGGLEFGEGTRECLKREFQEEMKLNIRVSAHLYTTDFFQMSAFRPEDQIISVYYYVEPLELIRVPLRHKPFDFDERQMAIYHQTGETESFRFIDWTDFSEQSVTLPIDKVVAGLLKNGEG